MPRKRDEVPFNDNIFAVIVLVIFLAALAVHFTHI